MCALVVRGTPRGTATRCCHRISASREICYTARDRSGNPRAGQRFCARPGAPGALFAALFALARLLLAHRELLDPLGAVLLHVPEDPLVAQVERLRVLPVVRRGLREPLDDVVMVGLDGELAPRIEAPRGEVDRADDGARLVREQHLAVQLHVLEA